MKKLILLVGIPGCGKTTLSTQLVERGFLCLNADSIRLELWGDASDQREPEKVFGIFFQRLEEAMSTGADIVIDNTNINSRHRQPILERAAKFDYKDVQIWTFDVPLEICLTQNQARERAVPDDIVRNMYTTLNGSEGPLSGNGAPRRHEGKRVIVRRGDKDFSFRLFHVN